MQREERIDFWTESTGKAEGIMLDFSPNGLLLLCAVPLPEQAHIRLSTSLFIATGRVTHCTEQTAQRPSRFAVGVAFSEVQFENSTGSLLSATI